MRGPKNEPAIVGTVSVDVVSADSAALPAETAGVPPASASGQSVGGAHRPRGLADAGALHLRGRYLPAKMRPHDMFHGRMPRLALSLIDAFSSVKLTSTGSARWPRQRRPDLLIQHQRAHEAAATRRAPGCNYESHARSYRR